MVSAGVSCSSWRTWHGPKDFAPCGWTPVQTWSRPAAFYAALGYVEVPFNNGQYAEHWFATDLRATTRQREAPNR